MGRQPSPYTGGTFVRPAAEIPSSAVGFAFRGTLRANHVVGSGADQSTSSSSSAVNRRFGRVPLMTSRMLSSSPRTVALKTVDVPWTS